MKYNMPERQPLSFIQVKTKRPPPIFVQGEAINVIEKISEIKLD